VQLFGEVPLSNNPTGVNGQANFSNFVMSALTLIRIVVGGDWCHIMYDCMAHTSHAAPLYFMVFMVGLRLPLLSLLSVAIVDGMCCAVQEEKALDPATGSDLRQFMFVWSWYDPSASGLVPVSRLPGIVGTLPPPFGVRPNRAEEQYADGIDVTIAKALVALPGMRIKVIGLDELEPPAAAEVVRYNHHANEQLVRFHDLLEALCWHAAGNDPIEYNEDVALVLHGRTMRALRKTVSTWGWPEAHRVVTNWREKIKMEALRDQVDKAVASGHLDLPSSVSPVEQLAMLEDDAATAMADASVSFDEVNDFVEEDNT